MAGWYMSELASESWVQQLAKPRTERSEVRR
jgi:hypothetical protein